MQSTQLYTLMTSQANTNNDQEETKLDLKCYNLTELHFEKGINLFMEKTNKLYFFEMDNRFFYVVYN